MTDSTVLVVGGTGGIGAAVCRRLASEWGRVLIGFHRQQATAISLAAELGHAAPTNLDLSDLHLPDEDIAAIVVASGYAIEQPMVADVEECQWRAVIETELLGFTALVGAILPRWRARGGGALVAITSFANTHFPPGDALSSVPKAGVEAVCRAVAKEEGRHRVRMNCVAPAMVNAGLGARYQREMLDSATWDRIRRHIPLGRFAEADDIAEAVAFLLSTRASFVTGQTLIVDGGQSL